MVSIIVPIYNVEEYLHECVDSVLAQTYSDIEIILVDDGSTDCCGEICDQYEKKDCRIKTIHKKNGGLSDARNVGFDVSNGEYIYFLDADDYIIPNAIEKLVNNIETEGSDFVYFDANTIYDDFSELGYKESFVRKGSYKTKSGVKSIAVLLDNNEYYPCVPLLFFKREFLIKNDMRFEKGIIHEDELFSVVSFLKASKVSYVKELLYVRRLRADSIMSLRTSEKSFKGVSVCILHMLEEVQNYSIDSLHYQVLVKYISLLLNRILVEYAEFDRDSKKNVYELFVEIRDRVAGYNYFNNRKLSLKMRAIKAYALYYLINNRDGCIETFKLKRGYDALYRFFRMCKKRIEIYLIFKKHQRKGERVIIIATPTHGNLGDQAIVCAEKRLLKRVFSNKDVFEIPNDIYIGFPKIIKNYIVDEDVVVIDGGGNLGTIWKNEDDKICDIINRFKKNRIIVFPQTCYYDDLGSAKDRINRNCKCYLKSKKLSVMLRDKNSFELFTKIFPGVRAHLVPDIVLSMNVKNCVNRRKGALVCFRSDCERVSDGSLRKMIISSLIGKGLKIDYTSTVIADKINSKNRNERILSIIKEFSLAEVVVTDRLHAMLFCAVSGTPCIAIDNLSKKVSGGYEWIKDLDYICFVNTIQDVDEAFSRALEDKKISRRFSYPLDIVNNIINEV